MAHDTTPKWDSEVDELGLNQVDLDVLFGRESLNSSARSIDLPRSAKPTPSPKPSQTEELPLIPEREDRQPSFSGKDEIPSVRENRSNSPQLVSFADGVIRRTKTASVSSVGSSSADAQKTKEITVLKREKQELMEKVTEAERTVAALKREIQELRWAAEQGKVSLEETNRMDLVRGQFIAMDKEREAIEGENQRLRDLLSAAMKEKVQFLALKQENEQLKAEICALTADQPDGKPFIDLKSSLQIAVADLASVKSSLAASESTVSE